MKVGSTEARHYADSALQTIIKTNSNSRWLLGYVRTIAQIEAVLPGGDSKRILALYFLGERIARFLGDSLYEVRCASRAFVSLRKLDQREIRRLLEQARHEPRFSESDLADWVAAMENGNLSENPPLTLKKLMQSPASVNFEREASGLFSDLAAKYNNVSWVFDAATGLLVDFVKESYLPLAPDSPTARIIEVLTRSTDRRMKQDELFEKVWKIRWNSERHLNTLKVALTRFNQNESCLKIIRENDSVCLNLEGTVIEVPLSTLQVKCLIAPDTKSVTKEPARTHCESRGILLPE